MPSSNHLSPTMREAFGGDTMYLARLEMLVAKITAKQIMAGRRKLFASWAKKSALPFCHWRLNS
ncbi:MAG: hypothetical protein U0Y68_25475 [Blastocatellia bacterium]